VCIVLIICWSACQRWSTESHSDMGQKRSESAADFIHACRDESASQKTCTLERDSTWHEGGAATQKVENSRHPRFPMPDALLFCSRPYNQSPITNHQSPITNHLARQQQECEGTCLMPIRAWIQPFLETISTQLPLLQCIHPSISFLTFLSLSSSINSFHMLPSPNTAPLLAIWPTSLRHRRVLGRREHGTAVAEGDEVRSSHPISCKIIDLPRVFGV